MQVQLRQSQAENLACNMRADSLVISNAALKQTCMDLEAGTKALREQIQDQVILMKEFDSGPRD